MKLGLATAVIAALTLATSGQAQNFPSHIKTDDEKAAFLGKTSAAIAKDVTRYAEQCEQKPNQAEIFQKLIEDAAKRASKYWLVVSLEDTFTDTAIDCMNVGAPEPVTWRPDAADYMSHRVYTFWAAEQDAAEKARVAALLREQAIRLREEALRKKEAERNAYEVELTRRIFSACVELEEKDSVAAYTNETCVGLFRLGGMPNWEFDQ